MTQTMTDVELVVAAELVGIRLFGFDTYKHENRHRAARLRAELTALDAEIDRRGLRVAGGIRADLAAAVAASPEVQALSAENEAFFRASL